MAQRPSANKYCLLRYDYVVRSAVNLRLKQSSMTIDELAKSVGTGRTQLNKYLRGNVIKSITQWQLIQVCERLGIEVSIKVEMK